MEDKKAKILVVDDEPEIVEALRHFLSVRGYDVAGALSGADALSILEKDRADLILLDMMMPGLMGTEVARIIKEKYPSVKLIAVTGYPEEGKKIAQDAEGVFIKPVGIQELYNKLVDVLGQNEMPALDAKAKQGITARVLLIKAKLLFVEPSAETYNFLNSHFKARSSRGEDYDMDAAAAPQEILGKITQFQPDMFIANMPFLSQSGKDLIERISQLPNKPKEIIGYNLNKALRFEAQELERLTKTVQAFSFKNGLIEIK